MPDNINKERANQIANSLSTPEDRIQLAADMVVPMLRSDFYAELNPSLSLTINTVQSLTIDTERQSWHSVFREAYEVSNFASAAFITQEEEVLNDWLFFHSLRKEEREFQKVKNAINNSIEQMEV